MDTSFKFEIFSPQGEVFSDQVKEVSVPTEKGEISILPNHISLFTKLTEGEIKIHTSKGERIIAVIGGFLETKDNIITVLSDYAIKAENIQASVAEAKTKKTQELMKDKNLGADFLILEKEMQRSLLELKIASKMKLRSRPQGQS